MTSKQPEKRTVSPPATKKPYPFWLGGESPGHRNVHMPPLTQFLLTICCTLLTSLAFTQPLRLRPRVLRPGVAASVAASITHPLDLTKVRLQTSGDKGMLNSIKKTVTANGEQQQAEQHRHSLAI